MIAALFATILRFLKTPAGKIVAGLILITVVVLGLVALGAARERSREEARDAIAQVERLKMDSFVKEKLQEDRVLDIEKIAKAQEELTDAVAALPDETPSPRRVALACERLRQQGTDVSDVPACHRPNPASEAPALR